MTEQGQTGRQGEQGAAGVQGHQGVQGIQGQQGKGLQGEPGLRGERGIAGQPWRSRNITGSFIFLTVIFVVIVGFTGYESYERRQLNGEVHALALRNRDLILEVHSALCAQKVKDQKDVKRAQEYLQDVADGTRNPIPGLTEADVREGMKDEQEKVTSLSALQCKSSS